MNENDGFVLDLDEQAEYMAQTTELGREAADKWMEAEEQYLFEHGLILVPGVNCTEEELQASIDHPDDNKVDLDCADMAEFIIKTTGLSEKQVYALMDAEYEYERKIGLVGEITVTEEIVAEEKVKRAASLSKELFAYKKDKSGVEYYKHPEKVASLVHSDEEKIVAYLHDVLEDTDYPEEKMREEFGDSVTDAVLLLTHKEKLGKEGYLDYIRALKQSENDVAIKVKLADLTHNSDISRLGAKTVEDLTAKQRERYEKYQEAIRILEDNIG